MNTPFQILPQKCQQPPQRGVRLLLNTVLWLRTITVRGVEQRQEAHADQVEVGKQRVALDVFAEVDSHSGSV